jgi:hypothetical protein
MYWLVTTLDTIDCVKDRRLDNGGDAAHRERLVAGATRAASSMF